MKTSVISLLIATAAAFPAAFNPDVIANIDEDAFELAIRQSGTQDALGISKARTNCGPTPCLTFSEAQEVSVAGEHVFQAPRRGDIRGLCPGLNAAANHGYLPRTGIASIEETVAGLGAAYGLGGPASAFLAAYAIALDGNLIQQVWSIGGPLPKDEIAGGLLGTGQGLDYSHNNYEGDASIGRNDAYLNNGDAHSLNVTKFEKVYAVGGKEDRYTLDKFASRFEAVQQESIDNNPYFFTGAFSTFVVVPAAYNFVINLMSNHTKEIPSGYLDGYNFKSFFSITGKPGSFKWTPGHEKIPKNWYKRSPENPYGFAGIGGDVGIAYAAYPKTLKFGGNTGKPNSFVGLNVADASGGVFNAQNLFKGNNFGCFAFGLAQQGIPAFAKGPALTAINAFVAKYLGPATTAAACPQLGKYDAGLFSQYPGRNYHPKAPSNS